MASARGKASAPRTRALAKKKAAPSRRRATVPSGTRRRAVPVETRAERAQRKRQAILVAAADAFARDGYLGINLNDIVQDLGLTKGTFYFHFGSKESLASEIVDAHFAVWDSLVAQARQGERDPLAVAVGAMRRLGSAFESDPVVRAGARLLDERHLIGADLPDPYRRWATRLARLLRDAQTARRLSPAVDPGELAHVVVTQFFGADRVTGGGGRRPGIVKELDRFWAVLLPLLEKRR